MSKPLHIVILAAGEGTRMKSRLPKVLQPLGGRPMLQHLLDSALALQPDCIHVVVGSGAEAVREACRDYPVNWVQQDRRLGTGHAVMQAMPDVPDGAAVLVLLGDKPIQWFLKYYVDTWKRLSDFPEYGQLYPFEINGQSLEILPLAHPRQVAKLGR